MLSIVFDNGETIHTKANWFRDSVLMLKDGDKEEFIAVIPKSANAVVVKTNEMLSHKFNIIDAIKFIEDKDEIPVTLLKALQAIINKKRGIKSE
jgi:hypothetical protein